jgi:23S rRNA pseudouridine2605 synthase
MAALRTTRKVGLARVLSKLGYCSRSQAAELIGAGHVSLNGKVRRDPEYPVNMEKDRVDVDGGKVSATQKIYLILNKPRGVVTSAWDPEGRETVYDCMGEQSKWVAPVGRLDKASEGLLLLTNDSEWGARIASPKSHLDKTYHVRINAHVEEAVLENLRKGIRSDGDLLRVKTVRRLRGGSRRSWVEIVLDEGKNRQIRRMFKELDIEVVRLVRVAIGPLELGELGKGASRALTKAEKKRLDEAMQAFAVPNA